jgi:16S rRNA (cytidine1402-2'-O)-methyltransferase
MSKQSGQLYVVATPIGNLADFTYRAVETLKQVDWIAAEDTRHVKILLQHYGIAAKVISFHQHNEEKATIALIAKLLEGESIALVSDAGTPLICDPGLPLISAAREAGIRVVPVPGACALITALSAAGLPLSKFTFEGFLPRTSSARRTFFEQKRNCAETWVFYESSHRILATLKDLALSLPLDLPIVLARELTKLHETIVQTDIQGALVLVEQEDNMRKGEFVVIVAGSRQEKQDSELTEEQRQVVSVLLKHLSIKSAVEVATEITGVRKKILYQTALEMTGK